MRAQVKIHATRWRKDRHRFPFSLEEQPTVAWVTASTFQACSAHILGTLPPTWLAALSSRTWNNERDTWASKCGSSLSTHDAVKFLEAQPERRLGQGNGLVEQVTVG